MPLLQALKHPGFQFPTSKVLVLALVPALVLDLTQIQSKARLRPIAADSTKKKTSRSMMKKQILLLCAWKESSNTMKMACLENGTGKAQRPKLIATSMTKSALQGVAYQILARKLRIQPCATTT